MVTIERESNSPYRVSFGSAPLKEVANHERPMPDKFISADGMGVTRAFREYIAPLVGELPRYASLKLPERWS
jgi:6-phosphofructokinase 1